MFTNLTRLFNGVFMRMVPLPMRSKLKAVHRLNRPLSSVVVTLLLHNPTKLAPNNPVVPSSAKQFEKQSAGRARDEPIKKRLVALGDVTHTTLTTPVRFCARQAWRGGGVAFAW